MLKTLIKKQLLAFAASFTRKRDGSRRKAVSVAVVVLVMLVAAVSVGAAVWFLADTLAEPMFRAGAGWLFFGLMAVLALVVGVLGSIFATYSTLYAAKDNDLLLSLPIRPSAILASRMGAVYLLGLLFQLVILGPSIAVWHRYAGFSAGILGLQLLTVLFLAGLTLALNCLFGWLLALLLSRVPRAKNLVTILFSLLLFGVYYYFSFNAQGLITGLLLNLDGMIRQMSGGLHLVYRLGMAGSGDVFSFLLLAVLAAAACAVCVWLLSRSFISIVTRKSGNKKKAYDSGSVRAAGTGRALLRRELKHYISSPAYILNGSLASFFSLVAAVLIGLNASELRMILPYLRQLPDGRGLVVFIGTALVLFLAMMNTLTAAGISIEGKSLWIVQSLPVPMQRVLGAKLQLHLLITGIPVLIFGAVLCAVLELSAAETALALCTSAAFLLLTALTGLALNLKFPVLHWTTETAAVKSGRSVMFTLFGGWGVLAVIALLKFLVLKDAVGCEPFQIGCTVMVLAADLLLYRWIRGRGAQILQTLQ